MFKIAIILLYFTFIHLSFAIRNKLLFSEPDYNIPEIPEKWRQLCGYRYKPYVRQIEFNSTCFGSQRKGNIIDENWSVKKLSSSSTSRVQHGVDAEMHESPWTVQIAQIKGRTTFGLFSNYYFWCTGVLITMKHILTAAHCYDSRKKFAIFAGNNEAFDRKYLISEQNFEFYPHPNYDIRGNDTFDVNRNRSTNFDLAIIVLNNAINETEQRFVMKDRQIIVNTVCLPMDYMIIDDKSRPATFFGWGTMTNNTDPIKLQKGDIKMHHALSRYCQVPFCFMTYWRPRYITGCKGDSGSGIVQYLDQSRNRAFLIGILHKAILENKDGCFEGSVRETQAINVMRHLKWIKDMLNVTMHN